MIEQIQIFIQMKIKYFHQFWSYIDLGIIICSWTSVGIFIWRYQESNHLGNLFKQTNGYVYLNLQKAAYINDLLVYLFAFCSFFGLIKLIRFARFNRKLLLFTQTIQHAAKDLLAFGMMFSIVFLSFVSLFYLLFVSKLLTCSTLLQTIQMLLQIASMKYDVHQLTNASPFLGPFSFSLFIIVVVFICLNMFISIVIDSFRFVRDYGQHHHNKEDQQIFSFMFYRFKRWITGMRIRLFFLHHY
jgi:hypothetical protein